MCSIYDWGMCIPANWRINGCGSCPLSLGVFILTWTLVDVQAANVEMISIPDPKTVMHASARNMLRRLDLVDDEIKEFFNPAAETVLASGYDPKEALARALAAMSGINEVPQPRSLLTQVKHPGNSMNGASEEVSQALEPMTTAVA